MLQVNNPDIFLVRGDIRWSACSLHGSQFRRFYTTLDDADVCRAEIDDGRQIFLCDTISQLNSLIIQPLPVILEMT